MANINKLSTIAIILPYFGKFPNYFDFWLESCIKNETIDFFIFTDNDLQNNATNIKVIKLSFSEFRKYFEAYFPFKISLEFPYKLCDYKIVYGLALDNYVKSYDFWGFCDCDLIFGNIRKFLTEDILQNYDHIYDMGQLQLQRVNDPKYLETLKLLNVQNKFDFNYIFTHSQYLGADELPWGIPLTYHKKYKEKYYSQFTENGRILDNPNPRYIHFVDVFNSPKYYHKNMFYQYSKEVILWKRNFNNIKKYKKYLLYRFNNGTLERIFLLGNKIRTEEILLAHFRLRKFKICVQEKNQYLIVPNKFISYIENPTSCLMRRYGYTRLFDLRRLTIKKIQNKIRRILHLKYII